jgi:hypothetical protein
MGLSLVEKKGVVDERAEKLNWMSTRLIPARMSVRVRPPLRWAIV